MENKDDQKKSNRLKFSRLCLSQTRNAGATRSQLPNSQISRFFSQPNACDEQHKTTIVVSSKDNVNKKSAQNDPIVCDKFEQIKEDKGNNDNYETLSRVKTNKSPVKNKTKSVYRSVSAIDSKSSIKSFFSNNVNDDSMADFEIPTKVAKRAPKSIASKTIKNVRSRRKQPDIRKALNKRDVTTSNDYSHLPEDAQLELAIAMSKAETQSDGSERCINLEAFEFKPTNANGNEFYEFFNMPKKTNARFKWNTKCTQLTRRKDDVQQAKVREKVDEILLNNIMVESNQSQKSQSPVYFELSDDLESYAIHSKRLQRFCVAERILFKINSCKEHTKDNILSYYTNNLVERSEFQAGVLLRDWSKIPGRDSIYDGFTKSTNEIDKTDTTECSFQFTADSEVSEHVTEDYSYTQHSSTSLKTEDYVQIVERECEPELKQCKEIVHNDQYQVNDQDPKQNDDFNLDATSDADATVIMDSNDIQLKVDTINTKIRLSQKFSDIFHSPVVTYEATYTTRAPSPDLFDDDDDDICMTEDMHEKKEEENSERDSLNVVESDDDTIEATSSDVVVISSSDCNSNLAPDSNKSTQSISQVINSEETLKNDNAVVETIDLLDSDSENMLKERIQSPVNDNKSTPPIATAYDVCNYEYENEDFIKPIEIELPNTSIKSIGSVGLTKKLSFTERLEFIDRDVMNGFTMKDLPPECDIENVMQSQDSIVLSDDEINYSMNKSTAPVHAMQEIDYMNFDEDDLFNYYASNPNDFNALDANFKFDSDEKLINQSVCNIFEKTFDHISSPVVDVTKRKSIGAKSLKKVNSETVFGSVPSSSTSKILSNRILLSPVKTPNKSKQFSGFQPAIETRMDLSNEEYDIRIGCISPKPNYNEMDASELENELRRFGLKPALRRRQAIICLEYIYNRTHPLIECNVEDVEQPTQTKEIKDIPINTDEDSGPKINFNIGFAAYNLVDEQFKRREIIKIFLPSPLRAKKPWCLEPLHIAWHNLIKANSELCRAVLLYEPINLIELKKFFKTIDMTFDNRDLISFLDMHCITFRMNRATKE